MLLSTILFGCASTRVTGHKLAEIDTPITKIKLTVLSGQVAKFSYQQLSMNQTINDLMPLIPKRLPLVFSANGLQVSESGATHELVLAPSSVKYHSYGGNVELNINAYIFDRSGKNNKVWEAKLRFWRPGFSIVDEKVADEFSKDLLSQLVTDGVVRLESNELRLPLSSNL